MNSHPRLSRTSFAAASSSHHSFPIVVSSGLLRPMTQSSTVNGKKRAQDPDTECTPTKQTRPSFSLDLKVRFIRVYEAELKENPKAKLTNISNRKEFGFSRSVASTIWKNKNTLFAEFASKPHLGNITRLYPRKLDIVEETLFSIIQEEFSKGI